MPSRHARSTINFYAMPVSDYFRHAFIRILRADGGLLLHTSSLILPRYARPCSLVYCQ